MRFLRFVAAVLAVSVPACAPQSWSFDNVSAPRDATAGIDAAEGTPTGDANTEADGNSNLDASTGNDGPMPSSGNCVDIISDPHCWSCSSNRGCTNPLLPVCDMQAHRCVECMMNGDCRSAAGGPRKICEDEHCVVPCSDNAECGRLPCVLDAGFCANCDDTGDHPCDENRVCNALGVCVDCLNDDPCQGATCENGYCGF